MYKHQTRFRSLLCALALAALSPAPVHAADEAANPPAAAAVPNPANDAFKALRAQCDSSAACTKAGGDICAEAAALLLGAAPPDDYRDISESQRIKIALRLLEKGVDSSDIAAGRAYDLYAKTDFMFGLSTGSYADPFRANELLEMMSRRAYPGAALRKARAAVAFFSMTVGDAEKRQGCALAAQLKSGGKLDADSVTVADQVLASNYCQSLNQTAPK